MKKNQLATLGLSVFLLAHTGIAVYTSKNICRIIILHIYYCSKNAVQRTGGNKLDY